MIQKTLALLGRKGRDKVTGFEGTIISASFDVSEVVQLNLLPAKGDDGKLTQGEWFDTNRIEVQGGEPVMQMREVSHDELAFCFRCLLGSEVEDTVTDFKGVASLVSFDLFGCTEVAVIPKAKKGVIGKGSWFHVNRLNVLSKLPVVTTGYSLADETEPASYVNGPAAKPSPNPRSV